MKQLLITGLLLAGVYTADAQHGHHHPPAPAPQQQTPAKPGKPRQAPPKKVKPQQAARTPEAAVHQHHMPDTPASQPAPVHDHSSHQQVSPTGRYPGDTYSVQPGPGMSHAYSLHLPMNRNGSGTGWLPDNSPMYGTMLHSGGWMFMLHGNLFVRYNRQDLFSKGSRGGEQWDAPNFVMAMGQRPVGRNGLFHFSAMLSADALIAGGSGYPLLFQTGESWEGKPLVDRQHPHDLFSELSVSYSQALSPRADVFVYLGYPGEPALGPVAFMHRPSAMYNPDAPITHHWGDGTHITFGVATLGVRYGQWKLEASSFTGREPDEDRYGFDKPLFDSRSARLSWNPSRSWALQASHGYVKSPEALHPGEDVYRTTASAVYSRPFAANTFLDVTGFWGMNKIPDHAGEHAVLLEGAWRKSRLAVYSRYEWAQKSSEELALDEDEYGHHALYNVHALTIGTAYDLLQLRPVRISLGGQLSLYAAPQQLEALYGRNPVGGQVYLRLYPELMRM